MGSLVVDMFPEPVQLQACEAGLSQRLIEILGGPRLEACRLYVNLVCKILALLITQGMDRTPLTSHTRKPDL